jgi:DNA replication protein DnaC
VSVLNIPGPGSFQSLHGHQQVAVKEWLTNCQAGGDKVGLWVYGDRGEGSTYIGSVAAKKLVRDVGDSWEYITARELMDQIRDSWSANEVSRGNASDFDLYVEAASFEDTVKRLWELKLLWIDDLYDEHDMNFWRKHVMDRVTYRVKQNLPTVICTNMTPADAQMTGLQKVIENLFVTCYAER